MDDKSLLLEHFSVFLRCRQWDEAKKLITQENIHFEDEYGDGISAYFCCNGPDDPDMFLYYLNLGMTIDREAIYQVAVNAKPRLLNLLIQLQEPFDKAMVLNWVALGDHEKRKDGFSSMCAKILIDAGAEPFQPHQLYVKARTLVKKASIIIIGLKRMNILHKDVLLVVARCVWHTRFYPQWEEVIAEKLNL